MAMDLPTSTTPPAPARHPRTLYDVRWLFVVILVAGVAFWAGVSYANAHRSAHDNTDFDLFWQSWDILSDEFYYDLPANQNLVYGAAEGLFSAAGDQYTFFAPPSNAELSRQLTAGEFGGIGAYVGQNPDGQIVIIAPFTNFPAEQAGLEAGDVVLAVDGTSVEGMDLTDAVGLLRGAVGTQVSVTILRPSDDSQFTVEITRAKVELPTVYSQMYGDVGYVRLFIFNENATQFVQREVQNVLDQGAKTLILDLRGNPGGLLDQAVGVGDLFLNAGVVVTQRNRGGDEIVYRSSDGDLAESIPLVVLIDENSASASEVVAGALHDRDRAVLIGQTSFGKGSVQYVHDLPDGSQIHVTTALWFTPKETPIQGTGLTPDVVVDSSASDDTTADQNSDQNQDPYIDAALAYIQEHHLDEQSLELVPTGISDGNQS